MLKRSDGTTVNRGNPWQYLATAFCILFGIAFILNVHPIGDGLWFWYASLLRGGQRLYAEMHLPLQPFFIVITAWLQQLLGLSWLASKVLAVGQLLAYCITLLLLMRFSSWSDAHKAIVLLAVFGMTISAFYYRFDDYHVTGHLLVILSIYLLLLVQTQSRTSQILPYAGILGIISGVSLANRINDGAALFVGVAVLLSFFVMPRRKLPAVVIFVVVSALTLWSVIALTGDTVHDWMLETIIRAASIKGGTDNVMRAPIQFPLTIAREIRHAPSLYTNLGYALVVVLFFSALLPYFGHRIGTKVRLILLGLAYLPIVVSFTRFSEMVINGYPIRAIENLLLILFYPLICLLLLRVFRAFFLVPPTNWNPRELLLILPFGQLLAGAMTSSQSFLEAFPPVAIIRPTSTKNGGAVASVVSFANDGLFIDPKTNKNTGLVQALMGLAEEADEARRQI